MFLMNYDNKTPTKPPDRSSQNTYKKKRRKKKYKLGRGTVVIKYSFGFVSCGLRVAPYPQALFYEAVYFYLKNISTVKNFVQKIINYRDIKYVINKFFNYYFILY